MHGKGYLRLLAPWGAMALCALLAVLAWQATCDSVWPKTAEALADAAAATSISWPLVIVVLGLGAAALVFVFVGAAQRARRLAEGLAQDMTASLRTREDELERYATALQQANESLEVYSMSALQATHAKSLFLANTSHELRTPLTVILGFAEMLRGETLARQTQDEAVDAVLRSAAHLLQLIDDLLDLSKIEAGTMTVAVEPCALQPLLADVVGMVESRAQAKGLTLAVDQPPALPAVIHTDPRRLRQILINLLVNAIKFTDRGGVQLDVRLDGALDKATLECAVRDTGIGMSAQHLSRIFHPFAQADGQIGTRYGGTGLGLAISRRLAELLGGGLTVESELGRGSTFRLSLPAGDLTAVPHTGLENTTQPLPHATPAATPRRQSDQRPLEGLHVLLAEDSPDNRRLLGLVLEKAGATLTAVENGQQACDAVGTAAQATPAFDLILMDMEMPVLDGFGATRQLRETGYRGRIVALTARAMHEDAQRCLDAGCDDYATKPIRRDTLVELVARHARSATASPAG